MNIGRNRTFSRIRPDNLILMLIFTVSAFALMWSAVSCFNRIKSAYSGSSECLGAAHFLANRLRSAEGDILIETGEDNALCRITISRNDGYETIITMNGGILREALVPADSDISIGEPVFETDRIFISESLSGTVRITACSASESVTLYAEPSAQTEIVGKGDGV